MFRPIRLMKASHLLVELSMSYNRCRGKTVARDKMFIQYPCRPGLAHIKGS